MVTSRPGEQRLDPGYILKVKLIDFLMEIGCELLRAKKNSVTSNI